MIAVSRAAQVVRRPGRVGGTRRSRAAALAVAAGLLFSACGSDGLSADAGEDAAVEVGTSPAFDGCGSSGEIVNYQWVIREAPASMAADVDKAIRESMDDCSFTLEASMLAEEVGAWTIELIVTDADGGTSSDQVVITVTE